MEIDNPNNIVKELVLAEEETIYDVNSATLRLLHSKYGKALTGFIVVVMVWVIILMIYWYITLQFPHPYFFFLVVVPFLALYATVRGQARATFMKQFALANGYEYIGSEITGRHEVLFLHLGEHHTISNYIVGKFGGCRLELFNYSYVIRSGKARKTLEYTVFCVEFETLLPDMLLLYENQIPVQHLSNKGRVQLKMEGDFESFYELYISPGFEIEALQIFDREFMTKLESDWKGFSLEFSGNRIYLYNHAYVDTKRELDRMYALTQYLVTHLRATSARMDSGLKAMKEIYAPKTKVAK